MLGFMQTRPPTTAARIEGKDVTVEPGETILQAALRQGIDFPNSCRVGGCGACKCKLVSGNVRELTETGYLLTAEELEERTILACQSTPLGDVEIAVDLAETVSGTVVGQSKLTHDITRVDVQLDSQLGYRGPVRASHDRRVADHTRSPRSPRRRTWAGLPFPAPRLSTLVKTPTPSDTGVSGPSAGHAPPLFVAGGAVSRHHVGMRWRRAWNARSRVLGHGPSATCMAWRSSSESLQPGRERSISSP